MSLDQAAPPATGTTDVPGQRTGPNRWASILLRPSTIVWVLFLLMFPLSRIVSPSFPSFGQLESTLVLGLFLVVVSFGQGFVILTGGFDLSLPQVVALGAFLTGFLSHRGLPVIAATAIALIACAAVGVVNGLLVAYAKFPPFIVTLATGTMLASVLLGVSRGTPAQSSPGVVSDLFSGKHDLLGIATPIWALAVFVVLAYLLQMKSTLGRRAFAVGNSETASWIGGINVPKTLILVYMSAGIAYGIAGVMLLGYSSGADLNIGQQWLLPSITAVVIGGSAIRGGSGTFVGTIGGALLITILNLDISAAGFSEGVKQILYGVIILIALVSARFGRSS